MRHFNVCGSSRVRGSLDHIVLNHDTGRNTSGLSLPDHCLGRIRRLQAVDDARYAAGVRDHQCTGIDRYPVGGNHGDHQLIAVNDLIADVARRIVYIAARDRDQQLTLKSIRCQYHIFAECDRRNNRLVQLLICVVMLRVRDCEICNGNSFRIYIEVCRDRTAVITLAGNRRRRLASCTGIIGHGIIRSLGQCGAADCYYR